MLQDPRHCPFLHYTEHLDLSNRPACGSISWLSAPLIQLVIRNSRLHTWLRGHIGGEHYEFRCLPDAEVHSKQEALLILVMPGSVKELCSIRMMECGTLRWLSGLISLSDLLLYWKSPRCWMALCFVFLMSSGLVPHLCCRRWSGL